MFRVRGVYFIIIFHWVVMLSAQSNLFTIYTKEGNITSYPFREKPVITFSSRDLILTTTEVEVTYPIQNIRKFTVNESDEDMSFKDITINDDELVEYYNEKDVDSCNIRYIRTFQDTEWQPLYVPFELDTSQLQENFEFATINNCHQYDDDGDGKFDRTILEMRKVIGEILLPNYPYLIKAKTIGTKQIQIENTILYATESYSINCSSDEIKYTFTGIYNQLENLCSFGYYILKDGVLNKSVSSAETLSPFRWYMQVSTRGGQFKENPNVTNNLSRRIFIIEEDEDETSDVQNARNDQIIPKDTYHLNGTKVSAPTTQGLYIMKMNDGSVRKIVIK